jgi:signal transduction histidine kinase/ActR/RegA family two-component response regulator
MSAGAPSSESVARHVLDNLLEGCQVIGFDYRYLYVNEAVAAQGKSTKERLLGRTMMECYPGIENTPVFALLRECLADRKHARMETEFEFPDGSRGWFELRFIPVPEGACILSLDMTAVKRTAAALAKSEQQLRHAQKMEAVGRLAGGVAHDFNNLLSVVLSYTSLLIDDLPEGDPVRADIEEIKKAGERAAALTAQLLTFSRNQIMEPRILDLNVVVGNLEHMLRRMIGENVDLKVVYAPELGKVKADPGHVEQVLLNLVVNARDAMPVGGRLTIETRNVELDLDYAQQHLGVTPGPHVLLAVSDTGVGMDKATQERIFEPFFTTKERGKGTGLGLATVFGHVRQLGGHVWVYSEPGKGATFKVHLPCTQEVPSVLPPPVPSATLRGSETILLVEDEEQLRVVTRGILRRNGYHVLEACDGAEALRKCQQHEEPIQLLLTDVVMPEMSGRELADHVLPMRPDIRVLYMSGYTEDAIVHHRVLAPGIALLQKPITPESLLRKVREVLDVRLAASNGQP